MRLTHLHLSAPDRDQAWGEHYVRARTLREQERLRQRVDRAERSLEERSRELEDLMDHIPGGMHQCRADAGLTFLGMVLLRLDYALLIAVLIGVSALVPVVGAYVGAITSALLLVMVDPLDALIFLIFLVCLQQVEGNVIYPRVVGTSLGLPGIWVLTAVTVGGGLFDLAGVLLSVPVASILYTLLKRDVRKLLARQSREPDEQDGARPG